MEFTRELYYGLSGEDVRCLKDILFKLGMYSPGVGMITKDIFGIDTLQAVCAFQRQQELTPNGVVTQACWEAVMAAFANVGAEASGEKPGEELTFPSHIGEAAREAINAELKNTTAKRREIVLDALAFAFDSAVPAAYPISLYIRGGNLYNTNLLPNVITLARIASGAARQPEFYDGGRREMMEAAVRLNASITGADCSGGVVGLLRHAKVVQPGFDCSADGFFSSGSMKKIAKELLKPGDLVHKSGHVGMYMGGGYVTEWMGGAYGCQLTRLDARKGRNFVTGKTNNMSPWTGFLRPTYY